jgi:hypothetical protein
MKMTARTREILAVLLTMDVPEDIYISVEFPIDYDLSAQCNSQADVRRFRALFPGTFWRKIRPSPGGSWSYTGAAPNGWSIYIYACAEAPPACRAIDEEIEVEEDVPVTFERRTVRKMVRRWECPEDAPLPPTATESPTP